MSVTVISLGTAGTQSGDKVRDAFSIVNDNFSNFQLSDLKGYYKYFDPDGYADITSDTWSYTAALLASIPVGTYIVSLSSIIIPKDSGNVGVLELVDGDNNSLGLKIFNSIDDLESGNVAGFTQITKAATFNLKLRYKCLNNTENGVDFTNVLLLLLKVS